jgi:hypothetical protein
MITLLGARLRLQRKLQPGMHGAPDHLWPKSFHHMASSRNALGFI